MRHIEKLRTSFKAFKQCLVRASHESLTSQLFDNVKERRPAPFIQMGRNFIKQQDRSHPCKLASEASMGKDQSYQQCFLFTGRATFRRHGFRPLANEQVGPM